MRIMKLFETVISLHFVYKTNITLVTFVIHLPASYSFYIKRSLDDIFSRYMQAKDVLLRWKVIWMPNSVYVGKKTRKKH